MQLNCSINLLRLKDVKIINFKEIEDNIELSIVSINKKYKCPICKTYSSRIHDYRIQKVKHINIGIKNVILEIKKKRFRCIDCNKRYYEEFEFLGKYQRMTKELILTILTKLRKIVSFKDVALEYNISTTTLFRIFSHITCPSVKLPRVLSIDEFKGDTGHQKYQCILVDNVHKKILDILPSRTLNSLEKYFLGFDKKERDSVKYFITDMYRPYIEISKQYFNKATIIIDKFHFARQCFWAFENVRLRMQKKMNDKLRKYYKRSKSIMRKRKEKLDKIGLEKLEVMLWYNNELREAYYLKENFYKFLDAKDRKTAEYELKHWINLAISSNIPEFKSCITTFNNWKDEILNYYSTGFTNGRTEGFNNKIKVIKRVSFGYRNFEHFKKRILFCCN